jgi:glycosyltransferase involved in cell wall biosynthesis
VRRFILRKLAIIDEIVSAGGVERYLHGLVGGLLELSEINDWDISLLLNPYNSADYRVKWPDHLTAANIHVSYLFDDMFSGVMYKFFKPRRIWGIYGTAFARSAIPRLLGKYGTPWLRRHSGYAWPYIEYYWRRHQFDVVHFNLPYSISSMECPQVNMPMVATFHDFNWKHRELGSVDPFYAARLDRETPGWLRRCSKIVVESEFIESEVRHFYPESAGKVRILRTGIPMSLRTPTEAEVKACRERLGLPQQFLLTIGWVIPHKNQKVLFEAIGRLRNRGINIPLVCCGPNSRLLKPGNIRLDESYSKEILGTAEKLGLHYGGDFWALGYVNDFEMECLYRLATALVQPSLYEGCSVPPIEAAHAGCAVVCSRIPPHVEEASLLGDNIWLFDPHDAENLTGIIERMLANPDVTAQRARRAAELVDQVYSWKKMASGYLSVLREALEGK